MLLQNNVVVRLLTSVIISVSLSACIPGMTAGVKPPSAAEIQASQQAGTLATLYTDISQKTAENPSDPKLIAAKKQIGQLLGEQHYAAFKAQLSRSKSISDPLTKSQLAAFSAQIEPIAALNTESHNRAKQLLQSEERKRLVKEQALLAELDTFAPEELESKFKLITELRQLSDDQQQQNSLIEAAVTAASRFADENMEKKDYARALTLYRALQETQPDLQDIEQKKTDAYVLDQLQQVDKNKNAGNIDETFRLLSELLKHPKGTHYRDAIDPTLAELAEYYNLVAQTSLSEDNWLLAYQQLDRANLAASQLQDYYLDPSPTQDFISQMLLLTNDAKQQNRLGSAMGYLLAIKEIAPSFQELEPILEDVKERLYENSIIKVATSTFKSPANAPGLGNILTAKIMHLLTNKDQRDIRLLERGSLDDILREQEIMSMNTNVDVNISSADFLVQGELLEASVDSSIQPSQQTKRVVVDRTQSVNPEHRAWLALAEEQRKKVTEPNKTIETEVQETITFTITEHRKVASTTSAFRVINPVTSKLLHTETIVTDKSYEDFSAEGIDIGLYVQKVKLARLPADSRILRELADQQAKEIATKLFERFKDPEIKYLQQSDSAAHDGAFDKAAEHLAMAIVLKERKEQAHMELSQTLREYALQAH